VDSPMVNRNLKQSVKLSRHEAGPAPPVYRKL
jgi:hypothetical protein